MNSKTVISAVVALGLVLAVGYGAWSWGENKKAEAASTPWVEVTAKNLFLVVYEKDNGAEIGLRALQTGDTLSAGDTVATDEAGEGIIHFPDGSTLRLDPDTRVLLAEGTYTSKDGTIKVRANLFAGRLWSQVIGLVTPESTWEVKTSNVVATVRGTAFGVEVDATGSSAVVGSESIVEVAVMNPKTGEKIKGSEKRVTTDQVVEIPKEKAESVVALFEATTRAGGDAAAAVAPLVAVDRLAQKEKFREWATEEKKRDDTTRAAIEKLKKEGLSEEETRAALRTEARARFEEAKKERRTREEAPTIRKLEAQKERKTKDVYEKVERIRPEIDRLRESVLKKENIVEKENTRDDVAEKIESLFRELGIGIDLATKIKAERADELRRAFIEGRLRDYIQAEVKARTQTQTTPTPSSSGTSSSVKPTGLSISSRVSLAQTILTGNSISLQAILKFSDGSTRDVTLEARWSVSGSIGLMKSPGVFVAGIPDDLAELGEASGTVSAVFLDKATGIEFSAKTPLLRVEPTIDDAVDFGGQ